MTVFFVFLYLLPNNSNETKSTGEFPDFTSMAINLSHYFGENALTNELNRDIVLVEAI
jgi:hypothetical protein